MSWTNDSSKLEIPTIPPPDTFAGDLLTREQTATFLGISVITLDRWVKAGSIPDGVMFNNIKKWSKTSLTNFIWSKFQQQSTAASSNKSKTA